MIIIKNPYSLTKSVIHWKISGILPVKELKDKSLKWIILNKGINKVNSYNSFNLCKCFKFSGISKFKLLAERSLVKYKQNRTVKLHNHLCLYVKWLFLLTKFQVALNWLLKEELDR